jgi:hypothetical protein
MISNLKKWSLDGLLAQFDASVHDQLRRLATMPGTTHIVVFENIQMDSSECGAKSALGIGPMRTTKTLEEAAAGHLGDLPSQRKYPCAYVALIPETAPA